MLLIIYLYITIIMFIQLFSLVYMLNHHYLYRYLMLFISMIYVNYSIIKFFYIFLKISLDI